MMATLLPALVLAVAVLPAFNTQGLDYTTPTPLVWSVSEYPDPIWEFTRCGRHNKSSVCDPNGLMSQLEGE